MHIRKTGIFVKEKIFRPVLDLLKSGVGPEQLALACSFGIVVGIIPLPGSTTLICILLAYLFRLNLPALQLVNYAMFPLQLLFFIPFFKAGGFFFEPLRIPDSFTQLGEMMKLDFWGTIELFWFANLQALLVWLILSIPSFFVLNFTFRRAFSKMFLTLARKKAQP